MIVAVVAAVVVVMLFWIVLIKPKSNEVGQVNKKVEDANSQGQKLRLQLAQLQNAKDNAPATQAKLAKFELLLPPTPDLPTFIREVQAAANADGIDLQSIAPSPPSALASGTAAAATGPTIETISVNLQVQGGFFRMESFLARLEDLQRVVQIKNLSMSPIRDKLTGELTLQSTITLTMYVVPVNATAAQVKKATTKTSPSPAPKASPGGSQ
jgi:Tfp pilus assembly protein PilO